MKKHTTLFILLFIAIFLFGCKKKGNTDETDNITPQVTIPPTATVAPTIEPTIAPTKAPIAENHDGEVISKLTGLWVDSTVGNKRPYAIMFNNIKLASPQSGISEAAITYEALVEGGITRLMGIFEELHEERIGSVRSARHYFVSFADEYDAIYVHFGHTTYASKKIKALKIDNISGLSGIGDVVFYRDKSIVEPHNAFASKDRIIKGTEKLGYDTEYDEGYEGHYKFYEEDTDLNSEENVNKITLKYSNYASPYFVYNSEDKLYYRYQFGKEHIDANTKKQLSFKNIIVQYVKEWDIDKNDYQTMDIENASGEGYYITNGKKIDITWKKNESTRKMRYYDSDGNELVINPGKTYISIFPNFAKKNVTISN